MKLFDLLSRILSVIIFLGCVIALIKDAVKGAPMTLIVFGIVIVFMTSALVYGSFKEF